MIDERAVGTAKFWEALRALRAASGLREAEFDQFALVTIGLTCMSQWQLHWSREMTQSAQTAYEMLMSPESQQDVGRFREVWFGACDALAGAAGSVDRADIPREAGSWETFDRIVRLLHSDRAWASEPGFALACFDEVFHRVVGRLAALPYRSGASAAALAAHLSAHVERISEYFTATGEFAVLRRTLLRTESNVRVAVVDRLNFFVGLRFGLYGIDAEDRPPREQDLEAFTDRRFLVVDQPHRRTSAQRPESARWADQETSLQALDQLLQRGSGFGLTLVVVPGVDRTSGGWRQTLRRHLIQSGRLIAVVDLPHERADGTRKQISAWLLGAERHRQEILMIDAKSLAGRGELREPGLLAAFVASVVSLGAPEDWLARPGSQNFRFESDEIEALLDAYFKEGYRDVEGICRRVRSGEVEQSAFKLVATHYLSRPERDRARRNIKPLLNSEPVLTLLQREDVAGKRVYVIGNNGEGKSILLGDLAERLVQDGRRVVGISFGLTDRFPYEPPKHAAQSFVYVGARTSERGITLPRTTAEVDRMVREIHVSSERLEVFSALVRHLGFGERRYLVPVDLNSSFEDDRSRYAELQQLTESVDENARILQRAGANRYVLGLMRQESQSSITTFAELSSGEQQLLTLALKLTAHANSGAVILIDEPELSLHVSWQRAIPGMLEIVGSRMGCSIVVATHSPVIVASATHRDDQCFVARRHALTELSVRQRRSVETALFDGFRTYTANNRQVHERCAGMVSQAIQHLNAKDGVSGAHLPSLESLHEELELMDRIIQLAGPAQLAHAREDLELVSRTRAALDELTGLAGRGLA